MIKPAVVRAIFILSMFSFTILLTMAVADAMPEAGENLPAEQQIAEKSDPSTVRHAFYAAMGSVGISCVMSGYALARIGSAALGAMSERPELGGRALIFLGMAEGIAIYGLIIAIMILNSV